MLVGMTISSAAPFTRCHDCYAEVPGKNDDDSSQRLSAVKAWNTRDTASLRDKVIEAVKNKMSLKRNARENFLLGEIIHEIKQVFDNE